MSLGKQKRSHIIVTFTNIQFIEIVIYDILKYILRNQFFFKQIEVRAGLLLLQSFLRFETIIMPDKLNWI